MYLPQKPEGQERALSRQSMRLSGMLIPETLAHTVHGGDPATAASQRRRPASQSSPVRIDMSWREFSHGTGTECIHALQALHRLCIQGLSS